MGVPKKPEWVPQYLSPRLQHITTNSCLPVTHLQESTSSRKLSPASNSDAGTAVNQALNSIPCSQNKPPRAASKEQKGQQPHDTGESRPGKPSQKINARHSWCNGLKKKKKSPELPGNSPPVADKKRKKSQPSLPPASAVKHHYKFAGQETIVRCPQSTPGHTVKHKDPGVRLAVQGSPLGAGVPILGPDPHRT